MEGVSIVPRSKGTLCAFQLFVLFWCEPGSQIRLGLHVGRSRDRGGLCEQRAEGNGG